MHDEHHHEHHEDAPVEHQAEPQDAPPAPRKRRSTDDGPGLVEALAAHPKADHATVLAALAELLPLYRKAPVRDALRRLADIDKDHDLVLTVRLLDVAAAAPPGAVNALKAYAAGAGKGRS